MEIKSRTQQIIEHKTGEPLVVTLRRLYIDKRMTQGQMALALDVSRQTVNSWLNAYGLVGLVQPRPRYRDPEPNLEVII